MNAADWRIADRGEIAPPIAELRTALRQFEMDDSSGDADRVARWYAGDAVWQPFAGPAVIGRPAIRERYQRSFAEAAIRVAVHEEAVSLRGSLASVSGRTVVTMTPRAGGATTHVTDQFVMLLRHESGQWKITALAWAPASVAAAQRE